VTLNGPALVSEAKEEQTALRDELKTVLDEMVYNQLAEKDANLQRNVAEIVQKIPNGIYVG
jgi:anti-sigma28 factor (negative regulator of flagellin synthesis)